jgi:hypothetical protein
MLTYVCPTRGKTASCWATYFFTQKYPYNNCLLLKQNIQHMKSINQRVEKQNKKKKKQE